MKKAISEVLMRVSLITIVCLVPGASAQYASEPDPDPEALDAILYRKGYVSTLTDPTKPIPFFLAVDTSGTGRLVDYGAYKKGPNGFPENWTNLVDKGTTWQKLTREEATNLWGEPQEREVIRRFFTWDAFGTWNKEKNLYHLDFELHKGHLISYRVRGIGISNPQWVSPTGVLNEY